MLRRLLFITPLLLVLLYSSPAHAETLGFDGTGKGVWGVDISGPLLTVDNVFAGELDWTWLTGPPLGFGTDIYTYCIDVLQDVTNPEEVTIQSTNDITPLTAPDTVAGAGDRVAWLFNMFAQQVHETGTNEEAAGLQIAIWEALYDTTADLASGNIIFAGLSTGVATAANTYLQALSSASDVNTASALWLNSAGGQDQVTTVPEPASMLLFVLGAGLVWNARRRQSLLA
jgi:hypothetical protein